MDARADTNVASTSSSSNSRLTGTSSSSNSRLRLTVCRNWLEGTCPENNDTCSTGIHQYNLSRMPLCPSFEKEEICPTGANHCIYRHQCPIECIMYKIGFCPAGSHCFFTHVKREGSTPSVDQVLEFHRQAQFRLLVPHDQNAPPVPPPPPPTEEQYPLPPPPTQQEYPPRLQPFRQPSPLTNAPLQGIARPQQYAPRPQQNTPSAQQYAPPPQQYPRPPQPFRQPSPLTDAPLPGIAGPQQYAPRPQQNTPSAQQYSQARPPLRPPLPLPNAQLQGIAGNPQAQQFGPGMPNSFGDQQIIGNRPFLIIPRQFPPPIPLSRYFVMKIESPDTLRYSAKSGLWRTRRNIKDKLNYFFSTSDNVFLIFSSDKNRQFQGCAKMMSKIGDPVPGLWNDKTWESKYIGEFCQIRWMNLCETDFIKLKGLMNAIKNEPVLNSNDGQELDPHSGNLLFKLLIKEPNSDLLAVSRSHGTHISMQQDSAIVLQSNAPRNLQLQDSAIVLHSNAPRNLQLHEL